MTQFGFRSSIERIASLLQVICLRVSTGGVIFTLRLVETLDARHGHRLHASTLLIINMNIIGLILILGVVGSRYP
jgi:hypothetical protein